MATTVGQLVYNLEDYNAAGGYISTNNSNITQTITSTLADGSVNPDYENNKIKIAKTDTDNVNLVEKITGSEQTPLLKVGIQAPPGTKVVLNNDSRVIMIGRTGVYELDEEIEIKKFYFLKPKNFILDEAATLTALNNGRNALQSAEDNRQSEMDRINKKYPEHNEEYWAEYTQIQTVYLAAYDKAVAQYNTGLNGIYKQKDPPNDYKDLFNIIIDYVY